MTIGWNSARAFVAFATLSVLSGACQPNGDAGITAPSTPLRSMNGAAGQMPAYYDGQLFTVNMMEMPEDASESAV